MARYEGLCSVEDRAPPSNGIYREDLNNDVTISFDFDARNDFLY